MPSQLTDAPPTPPSPQGHAWRDRHGARPSDAPALPARSFHEDDSVTHSVSVDDLPVWHATDTLPLTAAIAHELRTPMQGLLGTLELLRKTPLTTRQHALLRVSSDAADALMRIANDVLDFTKLRTTQPSLRLAPCDLRGLIDDLITLLDTPGRRPTVSLETQIDAALAPLLLIDPVRLRQVLLNLISNALKFTDVGRILIRVAVSANDAGTDHADAAPATRNVGPPSPGAGAHASAATMTSRHTVLGQQSVVIEVIDSGIGIPEAELASIWRPFVQVDAHLSRHCEGSGLGLSIAKLMASRLGCTLTLESSVGVGTTARLSATWPLVLATPEPPHDGALPLPNDSAPPDHKDMMTRSTMQQGRPHVPFRAHVLVVDDHPTTRLILRAQLSALGHRVRLAEDADAAVALLRQRRFDLMLTDCKMPGRDGLALAAAWRHAEAVGALPMRVVGLTANPLPNRALQQSAAGFDECLVKPVTLQTLERLCDRRQPASRAPRPSPAVSDSDARSIFFAASAHRPSTPRRAPVDLPKVAEMFGCAATLERVLTSFATATLEDLCKIDAALRDNRPSSACQRPLHRLTGGLQVLGCHALANLGATLEQALVAPIRRRNQMEPPTLGPMNADADADADADGMLPTSRESTRNARAEAAAAASSTETGSGSAAADSPHDQRLKRRLHAFGVQVALCLDWLARQRIR